MTGISSTTTVFGAFSSGTSPGRSTVPVYFGGLMKSGQAKSGKDRFKAAEKPRKMADRPRRVRILSKIRGGWTILRKLGIRKILRGDIYREMGEACYAGNMVLLKGFLNWGLDPDKRIMGSLPPLVVVANKNHPKLMNMLLDYGADINRQDVSGRSALMVAAANGNTEVLDALLDRHSEAAVIGEAEKRFQDIVEHYELEEALAQEDGLTHDKKDQLMGLKPKAEALDNLKQRDQVINFNLQDNYGMTAAMLAAQNGNFRNLEKILRYNQDLTLRDSRNGWRLTDYLEECRRRATQLESQITRKTLDYSGDSPD